MPVGLTSTTGPTKGTEIEVMFREILTRLPDLRPAGEVERLRSTLISGIKHMPVSYTPE